MQVTNTSFTGSFLNEINQLETQQSTLQNEATTGLKVSLPGEQSGRHGTGPQSPKRGKLKHAIPEQYHALCRAPPPPLPTL